MSDHQLALEDHGDSSEAGASRLGWFIAGALTVIALIGLSLTAGPYLWEATSAEAEASAEMPPVIIEGY